MKITAEGESIYNSTILSHLSPEHLAMLQHESGIAIDVILKRGYRTIISNQELMALGFKGAQSKLVPCLAFPIHNVYGEIELYEIRPDNPRIIGDKPCKYERPSGSHNILDIHPASFTRIGDPKVALFITEGIKTADAIVSCGGCVVELPGVWGYVGTNEHGGKGAILPDWRSIVLKDRLVHLVFDNDCMTKPGVHQALAELKAFLDRRGAKTKIVYLPELDGLKKVGADDFLARGYSLDHMLKYASDELRPLQGDEWPDPEPLPDLLQPVEPFDFELLPGCLRGRVQDIATRMQCPPDFIAVGMMVTISSMIGYQAGIRPRKQDDWIVVPNLWGMCIGRPGVMKSPALNEAMNDIRRIEIAAKEEFEERKKNRDAAILVIKAKAKNIEKQISDAIKKGNEEEATKIALAAQDVPEEERRMRLLTNDVTVEKLGEILAESNRCILVYRDELGAFLRSMSREDKVADRGFYLEAWGGTSRSYIYDRIGRGTIDIERPCVSILGSIQPGPLQAHIAGATYGGTGDDGLLQRFQLAVWPDVSATWKNVDRWPDKEAKTAVSELFSNLLELNTLALGAEPDEYDWIPYFRFDDDAQHVFDEWRGELEHRIRSDFYHPALEAHMSKFRSLVPSIALICHIVTGDTSGKVGEKSILTALSWAEYLESHAQRIYSYATRGDLAAARALHKHIMDGDLGDTFSSRDVYRRHWTTLGKQETDRALEYLVDLGHIRERKPDQLMGRPRIVYEINPRLGHKRRESV